MVFSSLVFIFRFLPIVLGIYYLVPYKLKNFVLLIASLFFYSWGEAKYFVIMLTCIVVNYLAALLIEYNRKRLWLSRLMLIIALVVSLGMLFFL